MNSGLYRLGLLRCSTLKKSERSGCQPTREILTVRRKPTHTSCSHGHLDPDAKGSGDSGIISEKGLLHSIRCQVWLVLSLRDAVSCELVNKAPALFDPLLQSGWLPLLFLADIFYLYSILRFGPVWIQKFTFLVHFPTVPCMWTLNCMDLVRSKYNRVFFFFLIIQRLEDKEAFVMIASVRQTIG